MYILMFWWLYLSNLNQMQNNPCKTWSYQNVTTELRCYKMAFCFILFTASSPLDKSRQSPGTHTCQLCQGLVLAENHNKTRESISPGVMAVEWGINLDLECWEFWVRAAFSQAPLWLTFIRCNKHQHATDAVETLQSINLPVVAHAIHLHQWQPLLVCLLENIGLSWDDVSESPNGPIWINLQISAAGRRLELCTPHYGWGHVVFSYLGQIKMISAWRLRWFFEQRGDWKRWHRCDIRAPLCSFVNSRPSGCFASQIRSKLAMSGFIKQHARLVYPREAFLL